MKKLILLLLLLAVVYGVLLVLFPARQPVQASLQYFGRAAISYRLLQQPAQWIKAVQGTMVQPDSSLLVTDF
ncbi:MAG TPA: hypothetical protein PKD90_16385, partial [Phnomibacter sp.]|nr:hypothetical protein [Phnomibacter sp.]